MFTRLTANNRFVRLVVCMCVAAASMLCMDARDALAYDYIPFDDMFDCYYNVSYSSESAAVSGISASASLASYYTDFPSGYFVRPSGQVPETSVYFEPSYGVWVGTSENINNGFQSSGRPWVAVGYVSAYNIRRLVNDLGFIRIGSTTARLLGYGSNSSIGSSLHDDYDVTRVDNSLVTTATFWVYGRRSEDNSTLWLKYGTDWSTLDDLTHIYRVVTCYRLPTVSFSSVTLSGYTFLMNYWLIFPTWRPFLTSPSSEVVNQIITQTSDVGEQTEQQTQELKDTTGSGTILSGLTNGGVEGFEQNLGLLGQMSAITTQFQNALAVSDSSSLVPFPGITVLGVTIVPAQDVDLLQYGLSSILTPCKVVLNFIMVAAWLRGMKYVLDVQVLGMDSKGE